MNKVDKYYIYALRDPDNNKVRYIGKTNNYKKRRHEHTIITGNTKKDKWIEKLVQNGKCPIFEILEECTENNWHRKEIKYIIKFQTKFLLNTFKGTKHRTDNLIRTEIKKKLINADYALLGFYGLVLKLNNGKYWEVHGSMESYFFIFSKNKRYYISKETPIYSLNHSELPYIVNEFPSKTKGIKPIKGYSENILDFI